jgi:hypothetical protein
MSALVRRRSLLRLTLCMSILFATSNYFSVGAQAGPRHPD